MTDYSLNISIPFRFEIKTPPRGMTDYDPKALTEEQQRNLNDYKINVKKENIVYLAEHPEIKALVAMIYRLIQVRKPRNVLEYIGKIFTQPEKIIRHEVKKILEETEIEYEPIPFSDYEDWDF